MYVRILRIFSGYLNTALPFQIVLNVQIDKLQISSISFSIAYWMLAGSYLVIVRYFGLGPFEPPDINYVELVGYAGIGGFAIGLIFGLFPLGSLLRYKNTRTFLSAVFVMSCFLSCLFLFPAHWVIRFSLLHGTYSHRMRWWSYSTLLCQAHFIISSFR